ncbi:hypothetical protein GH714_025177 [Hevea brasiliensis]|uniref:Uncharacterized protein n=1 Tax=Hevea brasiliensis TaxID=3981 RepID=A0A6A6KU99_HEVBR|nr:hypothetical protein GH714_025177 [Hevea brasiliensis]
MVDLPQNFVNDRLDLWEACCDETGSGGRLMGTSSSSNQLSFYGICGNAGMLQSLDNNLKAINKEVIAVATHHREDFLHATETASAPVPMPIPHIFSWQAPPDPIVKLNFDAAVDKKNKRGRGFYRT